MGKRDTDLTTDKRQQLREELEEIASRDSLTEYLDMPDFLIASMLIDYLEDYKAVLVVREKYMHVRH